MRIGCGPGLRAWARLFAVAFPLTLAVCAQSLEQAEALWKARRLSRNANNEFRLLVEKFPKNPDYRVRWGRLFLDHDQAEEAAGLFKEALELKKDHAGALLGLALIAADNIRAAPKSWRGKRWRPIRNCWRRRSCWRAWRSKTTTTPRPRPKPRRRWPWIPIPFRGAPSWR